MINVKVDLSGFVESIDDMLVQLKEFPEKKMGPELTDWQEQDMHRSYPWTEVQAHRVYTVIWPRGLNEAQREAHYKASAERAEERMARRQAETEARAEAKRLGKRYRRPRPDKKKRAKRKRYRAVLKTRRPRHRPIIRDTLVGSLAQRMYTLLGKIHWL